MRANCFGKLEHRKRKDADGKEIITNTVTEIFPDPGVEFNFEPVDGAAVPPGDYSFDGSVREIAGTKNGREWHFLVLKGRVEPAAITYAVSNSNGGKGK